MKPNKTSPSYQNRVAEFEEKEKAATLSPSGKPAKGLDGANPYFVARLQVLKGYKEWKRNEILEMERLNTLDNRYYDEFVHEVAMAGDVLMPLTTTPEPVS